MLDQLELAIAELSGSNQRLMQLLCDIKAHLSQLEAENKKLKQDLSTVEATLEAKVEALARSNLISQNAVSLRVLLVDDSADNQTLVSRILKKASIQVTTASNGREAIERISQSSFDIVLMDLQMPELDGYEATRILRSQGYKQPIIALTAHAMREERDRCLSSGFDEHLTKPVDRALLFKTLERFS
jgi:CheY-like chemotaxis protein